MVTSQKDKLFKQYDEVYKNFQGKAFDLLGLTDEQKFGLRESAKTLTEWGYKYEQPSPAIAAAAVYKAPDAGAWQQFRVSLKGLSTQEKLMALGVYWAKHQDELGSVRVNNYIGALRRGGQLDSNLRILK